ncbi:heme exporter protein D [Nocardioides panzhihuensis]|uniref:Heme exporter protein D n=1 Tax=Nocardioides panzhihuensis TaxID=860243 RepID=A0A7Z0DPH7_9ACTN|nr:heme exporter protein D [Nocardioides panzhihuensis]
MIVRAGEVSVAVAATLAVMAVLAVEPILDRRGK